MARAKAWLEARGQRPTEVQEVVFRALSERAHLLVVAPTGSGKTAAVMLPVLASLGREERPEGGGVRVLYIAPVRALVSGHAGRIEELATGLGDGLRVGARTGDTPTRERAKLVRRPPDVLAVTPESLAVMLGTAARETLVSVGEVVLDEVHALASGKRGALLAATLETLADLRRERGLPAPRRLSLSATAGAVEDLAAWVGAGTRVVRSGGGAKPELSLAEGDLDEAYPSSGWTWRVALPVVARRVAQAKGTALVFVGARGRAEQWTLALRDVLPARMPVACYHGSLSGEAREDVARGLSSGALRAVVATSGLEAGVDLPSVTDVVVLSAPGSVTRLIQAAGRADHRPGCTPRATVVPTSGLDLVRCVAVLRAANRGALEAVELRRDDLDVAIQAALGRVALGPCGRDEVLACLRRAWPFRGLTEGDLDAVLGFLTTGGEAFAAYPEMARVVTDGERYALAGARALRRYLKNIGTIVSDLAVPVRHGLSYVGQVTGRFATVLEPGDRFVLAGRTWRVRSRAEGELQVRPDRSERTTVPHWMGARLAMSHEVAAECERLWGALDALAARGGSKRARALAAAEALGVGARNAEALLKLVRAQRAVSVVPSPERFLVEVVRAGRLTHVVAYTFAGGLANEVIARAVAARVRRATGRGAEVSAGDEHACVTVSGLDAAPDEDAVRAWLHPSGLREDLEATLEGSALAGAHFREVARVAQLWSPEARAGAVTPGLLYDVLRKHDPGHVLLRALGHTLWSDLEGARAEDALSTRLARPLVLRVLDGPSPLAIPAFAWAARDAVAPDDPEAALVAAAHALYLAATGSAPDEGG